MNTVPINPQPGDDAGMWASHPVIDTAERALRAYGEADEPMTRLRATLLLPLWAHYPELTEREADAVLARFGPPEPPRGGGWLSGSMGGNAVELSPDDHRDITGPDVTP